MAALRSISSHRVTPLVHAFEAAATEPGTIATASALADSKLTFAQVSVPGSVSGTRGILNSQQNADACDVWYRTRFDNPQRMPTSAMHLKFAGLATLADVWLNGTLILTSNNMFLEHDLDVTSCLQASNELVLRFRSLNAELKRRKGRPRWRTRLVKDQKLCQVRTALIGRIPAFTADNPVVGPYRPIVLEERTELSVEAADVRTSLSYENGVVSAELCVQPLGTRLQSAKLVVGEVSVPCE